MNLGSSSSFVLAVGQYQTLYDKALEVFNVFEDADITEIQVHREKLYTQVTKFLNVSGLDWSACGNLARHLHFLKYGLDRGDKQSCFSDVRDIVFYDLPTALKNLVKSNPEDSHFDQRLRDAALPLVQDGHYDSAIRKAFIVLTERLRRAFGVDEQVDGDVLANTVFGKGGKIPVALDESSKQYYRNLLSGFYGVYRNKFAHNDVEPSLSEVKALLEMVHNIIIEIEKISAASIIADM